jgi:cell division septal protein FtsQ
MRARFYAKTGAVALSLFIMVGIFAMNAEALKVKVIEVSGVKRMSAEKIYSESNIAVGENLLLIPAREIRDNILEQYPIVKGADVHRILPSKVRIQIHEREPYACVTDGERYFIIDEERVVLEKVKGLGGGGLFKIMTDAMRHAEIGEKLVFPHYTLMEKVKGVLDANLKGLYAKVMFNNRGIKVYLLDGKYVLLGDGKDVEKKIMLIPVIVKKLKELNEKYEGLNLVSLDVPSYIKKGPVEPVN